MCFSAEMSFGAGVVLAGAGIVAMKKVDSPSKLAFASIPLFFGIQQLSEGVLWLTLEQPDDFFLKQFSIYAFLFFGKVFWPFWIPFAIWKFEPNVKRKRILFYFMLIGVLAAVQLIINMFLFEVDAFDSRNHIRYEMDIPLLGLHRTLYLLGAAAPFFISSRRYMTHLGISLLLSLVFSMIFYHYHLISVWCFFAAILSSLILFVESKNKES